MKITTLYFTFYKKFTHLLPLLDGIPAFLIRLFLAPIFIIAGLSKMQVNNPDFSGLAAFTVDPNIVAWFGNSEWGLGLPFPELLANLAAWTELLGGWFLLFGLFTRLISIPLMFTMIIAITSVHIDNGWFAITPTNPDTNPASVFVWLGSGSAKISLENSVDTGQRLERMRAILEENGNTDWLYEKGNIVVLNNGIEFASTYLILLLALFFIGAGRFTSIDYYLHQWLIKKYRAESFLTN